MAVRKLILSVLIVAFVLSVVVPVSFAACNTCNSCSRTQSSVQNHGFYRNKGQFESNDNAWKKLGRGACNVLTFPFEIPYQISKTNNSDGPMAAVTWGLVKGVGMTGFRALVGVYEIITFPVAGPNNYAPILTDPEFFFEDQIW